MTLHGIRSMNLDHFVGMAILLLFFEFVTHLFLSMLDSTSFGLHGLTRKTIYMAPFALFVSVFLLVFLINLGSSLLSWAKELLDRR
jgi:ATP/ADP translocase